MMLQFIKKFAKNDSGATAIEYGLIAALVGAALITALSTMGTDLSNLFDDIGTEVENATPADPANPV